MKKLFDIWHMLLLGIMLPFFGKGQITSKAPATIITSYDTADAELVVGSMNFDYLVDTIRVKATVKIVDENNTVLYSYRKNIILDLIKNDSQLFPQQWYSRFYLWKHPNDSIVETWDGGRKICTVVSGTYPFLKLEYPRQKTTYKLENKSYTRKESQVTEHDDFFWSGFMEPVFIEFLFASLFAIFWFNRKKSWQKAKEQETKFLRLSFLITPVMIVIFYPCLILFQIRYFHLTGSYQTTNLTVHSIITVCFLVISLLFYKKITNGINVWIEKRVGTRNVSAHS